MAVKWAGAARAGFGRTVAGGTGGRGERFGGDPRIKRGKQLLQFKPSAPGAGAGPRRTGLYQLLKSRAASRTAIFIEWH